MKELREAPDMSACAVSDMPENTMTTAPYDSDVIIPVISVHAEDQRTDHDDRPADRGRKRHGDHLHHRMGYGFHPFRLPGDGHPEKRLLV